MMEGVFAMAKKEREYPKRIKADIERALIIAYYELICGLNVNLVFESSKVEDVVALAWSPGLLIGMDFSSYYHFTEGQKPQTRLRHLRRKIEGLKRHGDFLQSHHQETFEILYEIWCFIPPNDYVQQTMEQAKEEGLPAKLVEPEELSNRIKQTALIDSKDEDMVEANAFLWSAELLRRAGAFTGNK